MLCNDKVPSESPWEKQPVLPTAGFNERASDQLPTTEPNSNDSTRSTQSELPRQEKVLMATQSSLESFNPAAESIEDYKEWFDFHCTAHQIPEGRRKALCLTRIGCEAFAKLKTLVSPTPLNDLSLSSIVTTMTQHYKKDTVEIAGSSSGSNRRKNQLQIM